MLSHPKKSQTLLHPNMMSFMPCCFSPPCLAAFHPLPLYLHAHDCSLSCCPPGPSGSPQTLPASPPGPLGRCPAVQMPAESLGEVLPAAPAAHAGAACGQRGGQPCLCAAGHASEPSRPVSSSPPGCSAGPAPAKSSEARGAGGRAGWMGSNCQRSQRCTDVPNKFRGVTASSGPGVLTAIPPTPSSRPWLAWAACCGCGTILLEEQENQTAGPRLSRRNADVTAHSWLNLPGSTRAMWPRACSPP